jgi:DNA-binding transcriptional regulator YiaG
MKMKKKRIKELESKGYKVGDIQDFLELTPEKVKYIEMKIALSRRIKELREQRKVTQNLLAERLGSSQSRVSKIERGDSSVSIDLQVRSLLALGESRKEIARALGRDYSTTDQ